MKVKIICQPSAKHAISKSLQNKIYEAPGLENIQPGDILTIADIHEPEGLIIVDYRNFRFLPNENSVCLELTVGLWPSIDAYRTRFV